MSDPIPLMLSTNFNYNTDPASYKPVQAYTRPVGAVFGNYGGSSDGFQADAPLYAAWIVDRSNPNNPVVYKTSWASNTEVPGDLGRYLSDAYLLLFTFAGWITDAPAGDLYQTLIDNGGGGQLRRLQSLSTALACGVSSLWTYSLISTPGTGSPGVEIAEAVRTAVGNSLGSPPYIGVYAQTTGMFELDVELVKGTDNKYNPVRFGA